MTAHSAKEAEVRLIPCLRFSYVSLILSCQEENLFKAPADTTMKTSFRLNYHA